MRPKDGARRGARHSLSTVAAGALCLGLATAAHAQLNTTSGSGPIDITADNGTFENATCTSTWSGAAEVLQGDARLRSHVIKVFLKKKPASAVAKSAPAEEPGLPGGQSGAGCGATERIEADGDVFYVTPNQVARGDHAVYTADDGQIVMTGNVIVVQGKDVIHGDKMTIQVATHQVQFDSAAKGRGTPGRVRGVFYPNQPGQPGLPGLGAPAAPAGR